MLLTQPSSAPDLYSQSRGAGDVFFRAPSCMTRLRALICGAHPDGSSDAAKAVLHLGEGLFRNYDVDVLTYATEGAPKGRKGGGERAAPLVVASMPGGGDVREHAVAHSADVALIIADLPEALQTLRTLSPLGIPTLVIPCVRSDGVTPAVADGLTAATIVTTPSPRHTAYLHASGVPNARKHVPFGIDKHAVYPVPMHLARAVYGLDADDFVALSLCDNAVNNRLDVCVSAWAVVVARYVRSPRGRKPKLLLAAALAGAWDLMHVYSDQLARLGVDLADGWEHLVVVGDAGCMSDHKINMLYNASDIGVCVGDGVGPGTVALEHSSVGRAVVASRVGGHGDHLHPDAAVFVDPVARSYVPNPDPRAGCTSECVSSDDVAAAIGGLLDDHEDLRRRSRAGWLHGHRDWSASAAAVAALLPGPAGRAPATKVRQTSK
jgi:hypothetical protein